MNPTEFGNRIMTILGRDRHEKPILLLASILACLAILAVALVPNLIQRLQKAGIPDFPDCTGQSSAVVEYLRKAYDYALESPASDDAVGKLGMAFHAHLFYDEAGACYMRAQELNPDAWRWRYYAALIREELGDAKAAIEDLRAVVEKQPALPQAWFRLGNAYLKTQAYQDADRAFLQVLQLPESQAAESPALQLSARGAFPLKAYARLQRARIQVLQRQFADAKASLGEVIDANPSFGPAYRLLGSVCRELGEKETEYEVRAGDFDSYVPPSDVLYNALVLCSRNTDFITRQINIAVKWENYGWTVALINHILEYSPNDGEALTFKIKLALDTQDIGELGPLVTAFAEQFKSDEPKLLDMAKYLRMRGEYEASVTVLRKIISLNPKAIDAHIEFVRMLQTFKQYDLGIKYCTEVMALEPRNAEIRVELADLLIHKGQLGQAEEQLKVAQGLHPDEEIRWIMSGRIAAKRQDMRSALKAFREALVLNPRNSTTQLEVGSYLLAMRMWSEAAEHWREALEGSPNNIDFIEQRAWLLAVCPDPGIRDGKKALELAGRLALVKKQTVEQDIRCRMALSAACAETEQYDRALSVATDGLERARMFRKKELADRLQSLVNRFASRRPYRL